MEMTLPHPCPECGTSGCLILRPVLVAQRPGTFSLAGVQAKVSAGAAAEVCCSACGASRRCRLEGVQVAADGQTLAGGHFVADDGIQDR